MVGVLLALVVFPALSGATPSNPPDVTIDPVTSLTSTTATLNGKVNPNDPDAGADWTFSWGTTTAYTGVPVTGTTVPSETPQAVSAPLSALSPNTTYHYKLCATNVDTTPPGGTNCTGDQQFTTIGAPTVTTGSSSSVAQTSATLAGSVDPNGDAATWKFYYGTSSSGGTSYPNSSTGGTTGSGTTAVPVSDSVAGLTGNTTYFYRLCATNTVNTTCGSEQQLTTQDVPTPVAGAASNIGINGAKLSGTVNPNGANVSSTVFRYGISCMPPDWINNCTLASAAPSPGSGRSPASVSATLSSLPAGTTFHYTLCATNTYGTTCDPNDHTFTTTQPTVSIADAASVTEGQTANFVVTLSEVSAQTLTVDYVTSDGSAVAPGDYTFTTGTLSIAPGSCGPGTTGCQIWSRRSTTAPSRAPRTSRSPCRIRSAQRLAMVSALGRFSTTTRRRS